GSERAKLETRLSISVMGTAFSCRSAIPRNLGYLAVLKSGGTAAIQVRIDSTAEEGVYRFEARIELDSAPRSVFTDPFRVEQG
ncbi:hypothetical protein, partial [Salinibacter ruber]|uniref:hypothetical protein n=1 Tax=Salinibacter ruber TaxID=146919 RepID=UPI002169622E